MESWVEGPIAGFDTESTGKEAMTARLVTATVLVHTPGQGVVQQHDWLVAVDEPIPAEATAKHGVTTERAQAEGRPLLDVVDEITTVLGGIWTDGIPVVAMNVPYDTTLLNQELVRCRRPVLKYSETTTPMLDPLVIDRAVDKYRKGSRNLEALCAHYGVELTKAHTSDADALAAVLVLRELAARNKDIAQLGLRRLYRQQAIWYSLWASNYEGYLRSQAEREALTSGGAPPDLSSIVVDRLWPVRFPTVGEPAALFGGPSR